MAKISIARSGVVTVDGTATQLRVRYNAGLDLWVVTGMPGWPGECDTKAGAIEFVRRLLGDA